MIESSKNPVAAKQFADFLSDPAGAVVFQEYGFSSASR